VLTLTWPQVIARRLARSHLLRPAPKTRLAQAVGEIGLIQAQVLSAAELGIGLRVRGAAVDDVRKELYERRSLVKTWSIRGTLHLVPAAELPLWSAAVRGPANGAARGPDEVLDAVADALDGRCLTRAELADAVAERLGRPLERLRSAWGDLLHAPASAGVLCFGPPQGANVTFVRADQWIGGWRDEDPASARAEVLRRYLAAYAPATPTDFARWSGFGRAAAQELFRELAEELEQVRIERRRAFILSGDTGDFDRDPKGVLLLPQYDVYVIGFWPREPLVPPPVKERIRQDPKGRFESVTGVSPLVVDGVVAGLWRRQRGRDGVAIDVDQVLPLPRGRRDELAAAVDAVRAILD